MAVLGSFGVSAIKAAINGRIIHYESAISMTREERLKSQSQVVDELSVIKGHAEDVYSLGDSAEITINEHRMTASHDTMAYLCDFIEEAIKDAQTDYERIK